MTSIAHVTVANDVIYEIPDVDAATGHRMVAAVLSGDAAPDPTWQVLPQPQRVLSSRAFDSPNEPSEVPS